MDFDLAQQIGGSRKHFWDPQAFVEDFAFVEDVGDAPRPGLDMDLMTALIFFRRVDAFELSAHLFAVVGGQHLLNGEKSLLLELFLLGLRQSAWRDTEFAQSLLRVHQRSFLRLPK